MSVKEHIEVNYHIVQDKINEGMVKTLLISSFHQVADIFKKNFGIPAFSTLTNKLGLLHIYTVSHQNDLVKSAAVILRGIIKSEVET